MDILCKVLILLLVALFYSHSSVTGLMLLRTTNMTCINHNHKVVANLTCSLGSEAVPTVSMRVFFKESVRGIHLRYRVVSYLWGEEEDLYKGDFSLCSKGRMGIIMEDISAYGKLPSCPVPANTEYYIDHYFMDRNIVPPFIPEQKGYLNVQLKTGKDLLFEVHLDGLAEKE